MGASAIRTDLSRDRILDLFAEAADLAPVERSAFLSGLRRKDAQLVAEIEAMLESLDRAPRFLEEPVVASRPAVESGSDMFQPGDRVAGRFEVIRLLGRGGMGEVYEAQDSQLGRVAIKTLRSEYCRDASMIERFKGEVLRSREISHASVCRVFDLFTHVLPDGAELALCTMKLLDGDTLAKHLTSKGPFTRKGALPLLRQMASALDAAHAAGIVHRDFKPGNVFLVQGRDSSLHAVVNDFGVACDLREQMAGFVPGNCSDPTASIAGAPAYMAPEQYAGSPATAASDVYALGLVAYEMLSGTRAFTHRSPLACMLRKLGPDTPLHDFPRQVPVRWKRAIQRATHPDPANRFRSAGAFVEALEPTPRRLRAVWVWMLAALALTVACLSFVLWPKPDRSPSIAVLPFKNLSTVAGTEYLSDGIAGEISTALTCYPKLHVAARSSAVQMKNSSKSFSGIADDLGVRTLLTGSVERTGGRLRLAVQLVEAVTGREIWAATFDRDATQVESVQNEIAREVAARMLKDADPRDDRPSVNPAAHELFLKGRYFAEMRTEDSMRKALDYYRQAVAIDPRLWQAHAEMGGLEAVMVDYGQTPALEAAPRIRSALNMALSLEPDSAQALAASGLFQSLIEWDQKAAERSFTAALARAPSLSTARHWYGTFLMRAGRFDEALQQAREARRIDPVSVAPRLFEGWVHHYRRDYRAAIQIANEVLELRPSYTHAHSLVAQSEALLGRADEALRAMRTGQSYTTDAALAARHQGIVYSQLPGYVHQARAAAEQLARLSPGRQSAYLAIIYSGIGDRTNTYKSLRDAVLTRDPAVAIANLTPSLDLYRNEPEYRQLLRQLGYE